MFSGTVMYGNMHSNVLLKVQCTPFKIVLQMHVLFELLFDGRCIEKLQPQTMQSLRNFKRGCDAMQCNCMSMFFVILKCQINVCLELYF